MEILITSVSIALLAGLLLSPILILYGLRNVNNKYKITAYLALGLITTSIITLIFAWWSDASSHILLSHFGYDFDAINDSDRFVNVLPENMDRVKSLNVSRRGIGWPIKALITYKIYAPYLLALYVVAYLIGMKIKKNLLT